MRRTIILLIIAATAAVVAADTLELTGGARVHGEVVLRRADAVVVDLGYRVLEVPLDAVVRITGDDENEGGEGAPSLRTDDLFRVAEGAAMLPVEDNIPRVAEAVVQVRTPIGLGSGFVIDPAGYVVTNQHVISGEHRITVTVFRQTGAELERLTFEDVRIVALDPAVDLALLAVRDAGDHRFAVVPLGDSGQLRQGQTVFAVGSPLGLDRSVSRGIVSLTNRVLGGELYIQTTTAINAGNSGGPLFDLRGEVVGVTNLKLAGMGLEGLSFAIPVDDVKRFIRNRSAYAFDPRNPNAGFRYLEPPRLEPPVAASEE